MWYLIYTFAISEVMLGGRFGTFGLVNGGALLNQPYGHLYDNNELALAIAMLVPICWYCRQATSRNWIKMGLLITMVASAAAVVLSNSRGASLALGAVFLCLVARSRRRSGRPNFSGASPGSADHIPGTGPLLRAHGNHQGLRE